MTLNMVSAGPPKIRKNASKKNKKSWRKNVDMTEVEKALDEKLFEERIGGSFLQKKDSEIFMLDTGGKDAKEKKRRKRELKPLRCHSLLDGLPGVPDPKPNRTRTRLPEDRVNPVVKKKLKTLVEAGIIPKKMRGALANRAKYIRQRKETEAERKTRRRTKFDFDLWDKDTTQETIDSSSEVDKQWITPETVQHTSIWANKINPREAKKRSFGTSTLLAAVEVPHPGQSYNPAVEDHQQLLWKATIVELEKEKEKKRIERTTTEMFPTKANAPTQESFMKEMSEGIVELEGETKEDEEVGEEVEADKEGVKSKKPKTRKQRRDLKARGHEARKLKSMVKNKLKEAEITRLKSMRKELRAADEATKVRQAKNEEKKIEKMKNPIQLSKYKYEAPELEIKLSEELTGKLRNLKPEGSILEDRYKSMQRRNIVETRIVHRAAKAKAKKVDKRSHKMGWEADYSKKKNARIQKRNHKIAKKQKKYVHENAVLAK